MVLLFKYFVLFANYYQILDTQLCQLPSMN
jgi:hypothetical protein